jgi:aromatic ring-opening dioxygenase catalytic subunit (LigB family)
MAKIVGAYMSSHAPQIILQPRVSDEYVAQLAKVQSALMSIGERMRKKNVNTLIVFGSDHMETFFLDNYPQMLLFIGGSSSAKFVDKEVSIQNDTELALHLLYNLLDQGFDVCFSQEMRLDHPFASPLYWVLKTAGNVRVIPFHVNSNVSPRVSPKRCYQLGQAVRRAVEEFDGDRRVAVYGTGGLSHYPGTPLYGKVDVEADQQIIRKIVEGRGSELANLTSRWLDETGNFELRTWIAALGVVGDVPGEVLVYERAYHIGYCVAAVDGGA